MTFLNLQHKMQLDNSEHNITIVVPQDVTFLKEAIFFFFFFDFLLYAIFTWKRRVYNLQPIFAQ